VFSWQKILPVQWLGVWDPRVFILAVATKRGLLRLTCSFLRFILNFYSSNFLSQWHYITGVTSPSSHLFTISSSTSLLANLFKVAQEWMLPTSTTLSQIILVQIINGIMTRIYSSLLIYWYKFVPWVYSFGLQIVNGEIRSLLLFEMHTSISKWELLD